MNYLIASGISFIIVLIISPLFKKLAENRGFVDVPTDRKKHSNPTPLIGGAAMYLGFSVAYLLFNVIGDLKNGDFKSLSIFIGGTLVLLIGIVDDYFKTRGKEFSVFPRAITQLFAATLVFMAGVRFEGINYVLFPWYFQYILTVIWIFGVTTIINWSDGLDGLAGGLTAISGGTLFICAVYKGQPDSAMMAVILIGAVLAFLKYNFFPAKIFMGDSGATFLGFMLASISLFGTFKQATVVSVFIPVLALGLPIIDNVFLVIKRALNKQPVYKADAGQLHHRLIEKGMTVKQVVVMLFLISICFNLTSIIVMLYSGKGF